jgi:hypothetical protein
MTAKEERVPGGDRDIARYTRQVQVHPTSMIEAKSRIGLTRIRYDVASWMNEVQDWVLAGGEEEDEAEAIRREIQTRKESGDDDIPGVIDDDSPVFVESEQV